MKNHTATNRFRLLVPARVKVVALITLVAAAVHLLHTGYRDWNAGADTAYVLGLFLLFFSREADDDERVQDLKLKALAVAFFAAWAGTGVVRFVVYLQDRAAVPWSLSGYDVMFAMLVIAHVLFRFWRLQDGRTKDPA